MTTILLIVGLAICLLLVGLACYRDGYHRGYEDGFRDATPDHYEYTLDEHVVETRKKKT